MLNRASAILTFAVGLSALVSFETKAAPESHSVVTPRGIELQIEIEKPTPRGSNPRPSPILVLAPGQACSAKTEILDTIVERAKASGYATLRFQWTYCRDASAGLPSPFFVDEIEDLETALSFVKNDASLDQDQIVLGGKTQGSFVAYRVFLRQPIIRALALITPVCTYTVDNDNQPLPAPIKVGDENYPYLNLQRRPILMLAGSKDKSCLISVLDEILGETSPNVEKKIVEGDHAFRIFNDDGSNNETATTKNIRAAARALTAWLTRIRTAGS
jgi:predicted alpha/beta-hydrolase family hydrolase